MGKTKFGFHEHTGGATMYGWEQYAEQGGKKIKNSVQETLLYSGQTKKEEESIKILDKDKLKK